MRNLVLNVLVLFSCLLIPHINFAQAPDLGAASSFALFSAAGAFSNDGLTVVTGDIGTNVGAFSGFPPGIVTGSVHVANPVSAQAAAAVDLAYGSLSPITCGLVIGTTLGNGQILTPNVYCLGGASTLNGDLVLDGQCDPDGFFLIKINGALSTNVLSHVVLTNGASLCNVYWQVNGAVSLGEGSVFRGTILANGAISLLEGASLFGRALTRQGAIDLHNNNVDTDMQPAASVISANGATTFCAGGSVTLTGNCGGVWSNGATTASITVTTSGNYSVTNANDCGVAVSNHIIVTVNPLPVCTIAGNLSVCAGQSTQLCAPAGAASYLWSTGATTNCISTGAAGAYAVTVTNAAGCSSVCSATVVVNPLP
ncbi:MAG TPA: ice-binding family protein, partial [Saprospiraceae bacterium]|nr:ice-binding family protein [Saprospiraceae bacterium]